VGPGLGSKVYHWDLPGAYSPEKLAIFREDLESVITAIAYNHVTLPSHANAARHPQLTCEPTMLAKGREKHTIGAKNLQNALENAIREDHGCVKHAVGA